MRFGVLGVLSVWTDDGRPVRVPELKVRTLLAELLIHDDGPVPAGKLADDLWPDRLPADPAASLQVRVSQLRRALSAAEPGARALVAYQPPGYLLRATSVDSRRFLDLTARARATSAPRTRADLLSDALALWRGPALADFADAPFAQAAIARLESARLAALEDQAEVRLELGEHAALATELAALLDRHPLRERLWAAYLLALYRSGRQGDALDHYRRMRALLAAELGVDPGPPLVELHAAMLSQDPSLHAAAARTRTNLPAPVAGLVGRGQLVAGTRELLGRSRLVTLHGVGGVGKTRLALAVCAPAPVTADEVWMVELTGAAPGASTGEVAELVAATLGIRDDASAGTAADRVADSLRGRRALLVLDNCEHVVEAAAELAELLLSRAPQLTILTTTREPLGLAGETVVTVPPLDGPGAVELFTTRAGLRPTPAETEPVLAICARLDGIPLALELAATRARTMPVDELAARLDDRFRLLGAGRRGGPARQRTLRATIDWSWHLLGPAEQAVLRRLAVHADGCARETAEQVCAGGRVRAEDVPDLLGRLVGRSLVVLSGGRYRLLESVAAYCAERLAEAGESGEVRLRHARRFVDLAERAAPHLRGHDQRGWLTILDAESADIRAALETLTGLGEADLAHRLVGAVAWYWYLRGRLGEARRAVSAVLSLAPSRVGMVAVWRAALELFAGAAVEEWPEAASADGEWLLAFAQWGFGDQDVVERRLNRALAAFREAGDAWGEAAALMCLARSGFSGDMRARRRDAERAHALFLAAGDRWGQLKSTEILGTLAEVVGDYDLAARLHRDALGAAEELGLWTELSFRLSALGRIAMLKGDLAEAGRLHERAGRLAEEQANLAAMEFAQVGLGLVARRQGHYDLAEELLRPWAGWWRRLGGTDGLAFVLAERGFAAEQRGNLPAARDLHLEGLAVAVGTGEARAIALAFEGLAGVHVLGGDLRRAAELLGAAAAARESTGAPLPAGERADVDRISAAAARDDGFAASYARGHVSPLAEVAGRELG
ncbi:BTAD domain-containing putative transcriptional regulator [Nonomuraea sp. NPDC050394]|uniref:BTAD domain-containing putative transcriptional regulator n=1 Tax=Nonomuraea sp. NPDC050394 TaxID=3364363 RepID=UPI0037AEEBB7